MSEIIRNLVLGNVLPPVSKPNNNMISSQLANGIIAQLLNPHQQLAQQPPLQNQVAVGLNNNIPQHGDQWNLLLSLYQVNNVPNIPTMVGRNTGGLSVPNPTRLRVLQL
jgi:hypothetical protein